MFQNVIFGRNQPARWIQGKTRPADFFFVLFDHCIQLKHGNRAAHKARAQSVYAEINIELKHSPFMNKKKTKKKNGKGAVGAAGLYSQLMKVMLHGRIQ